MWEQQNSHLLLIGMQDGHFERLLGSLFTKLTKLLTCKPWHCLAFTQRVENESKQNLTPSTTAGLHSYQKLENNQGTFQ